MSLEDLYTTTATLDDPKVLKAFRSGDLTGIFQFGGGATRIVSNDVKPDNFLELADINALSRPGPLHSGATQEYIDIKHGRKKALALHPALSHITGWTKEQIIYQEQILAIVREIGGFDWTHAQEIRKIISLKHGEAAFNMREGRFLEGAERLHGIKPAVAKQIWVRMATAGTYAFNIAHSVSYSMLGYWTMWLKVHYPIEFYTACLRKYGDDRYWLLRDAIKHGIKIAPPDPATAGSTWSIAEDPWADGDEPNKRWIQPGFQQVEGIGEKLAAVVIADREENGPFDGWDDLLRVKGIGPAKIETIKKMSGHDPFGIYKLDTRLKKVRKWIKEEGKQHGIPMPTHKADQIPTNAGDLEVVWVGVPTKRDPRDVIEDERGRSGESTEKIKAKMKSPHLTKRMVVEALDDTDVPVFLRWNRFNFPQYSKAVWGMNLDHDVVIVLGIKRRGFGTSIQVRGFWVIDPDD
jgi:DNA polymerase-3 subunit alpha